MFLQVIFLKDAFEADFHNYYRINYGLSPYTEMKTLPTAIEIHLIQRNVDVRLRPLSI